MIPARRAAALLLAAAACATPRSPPPPAVPAAGAIAPSGSAPCGTYGEETAAARTFLETRAWTELRRALGSSLRPSGPLDRAARALAEEAARGAEDPLARPRVQAALRGAGAYDPAPTAHLSVGTEDGVLAALLARVSHDGATHVGIGDREAAGRHHLVLLVSRRRASLRPFPGAVAPGASATLAGELHGLLHPRAFVTRPSGMSEELDLRGGRGFSGPIRFDAPGLHSLEILGTGERGPEVAALLGVSVGGARCAPEPEGRRSTEPASPQEAEAAVVAAVNRIRLANGRSPLTPAPDLSAVARRHSERMRSAGIVAHVLPGGGELTDRLAAARLPYRRAFENVARGGTTLDAHAAIEASPAHRANLLAPSAALLGVGLARGTLVSGEPAVYLTEVLIEPGTDVEADRLTPDARVREALWRERERRALPALTNDPALEAIARKAALAMRAEDRGAVDGVAEGALRMGRGIAAADAFIASDPAEALRSRNLPDPRFRRVGVGTAVGDSRRFGPGRLFISVVYSD